MNQRRLDGGAILRSALVLSPLLLAASCVSESNAGGAAPKVSVAYDADTPQPSHATYSCGAGRAITVDNFRTSVQVVDPEGDSVELPASPATQQSRYGQTPYALVLDGNEALYMKSGKQPLNCRR
ncbi:hypothetical protein [Mesorhizobium sp. KR1-2]|uniref:hypothetical protein n=1 Tax=Mesorhizobium sp. KR1-2 TaxID=3156609 RepID=UPI0032B4458B